MRIFVLVTTIDGEACTPEVFRAPYEARNALNEEYEDKLFELMNRTDSRYYNYSRDLNSARIEYKSNGYDVTDVWTWDIFETELEE